MLNHRCQVLLIEDDVEESQRIQQFLSNTRSTLFKEGFSLDIADTLEAGRAQLQQRNFDVVLLDLMLPDSRGMGTLVEVQQVAAGMPIIVQSVLEDETVAVKALDLGACGYLPKAKLDANLLVYAIRTAIERSRQLAAREQPQRQRQEQELELLEQIMTGSASLDSKLLGLEPLYSRMPDVFEELRQRYEELLERALERQIYKVEYQISPQLDALAEQLGYLKATPRDIIELHTQVLKQKAQTAKPQKAQAYTEEGRFLLLELMGKLTAYYRRYYVGLSKINLAKSYNDLS
ncbi:MAG: response regulator [Cyanophyceae cyanobacterium]